MMTEHGKKLDTERVQNLVAEAVAILRQGHTGDIIRPDGTYQDPVRQRDIIQRAAAHLDLAQTLLGAMIADQQTPDRQAAGERDS